MPQLLEKTPLSSIGLFDGFWIFTLRVRFVGRLDYHPIQIRARCEGAWLSNANDTEVPTKEHHVFNRTVKPHLCRQG
jgi:hypothetical protein